MKISAASSGRMGMRGGPGTADPGRFVCNSFPLKELIIESYDVSNSQVIGPAWLDTERYDIAAIVPPGVKEEQMKQMIRQLLVDRFGLVSHDEMRVVPLYGLRVAKGGSRFRLTVPDIEPEVGPAKKGLGKDGFPQVPVRMGAAPLIMKIGDKVKLVARGEKMSEFAVLLSPRLDHAVVDQTGLKDAYDFSIIYASDESRMPLQSVPKRGVAADNDAEASTLQNALKEQLGLALAAQRGPLRYLVIDKIEKLPSPN